MPKRTLHFACLRDDCDGEFIRCIYGVFTDIAAAEACAAEATRAMHHPRWSPQSQEQACVETFDDVECDPLRVAWDAASAEERGDLIDMILGEMPLSDPAWERFNHPGIPVVGTMDILATYHADARLKP